MPPLAAVMTDGLRAALAQAHEHYCETYEQEWQRLARTESWQRIEPKERDDILQRHRIVQASRKPPAPSGRYWTPWHASP